MEGRLIIKRSLTIIGVLIIVGYSFFVLDDFIRGPRIILTNPTNSLATTTQALVVAGQAIHISNLSLNGSAIPFDLKGNFRETILLSVGYNRITVSATDRYNRTVEKVVELVLKNDEATSTVVTTATSTSNI